MKYKTLFRIVVKLIGVYLVATALASAATYAVNLVAQYSRQGANFAWTTYSWIPWAGPCIRSALGLYLFFGGEWIINLAIPANRPSCPECGYDLSGSPKGRCPECGTPSQSDDLFSTKPEADTEAR